MINLPVLRKDNKKPTILLLSDDINSLSGIGVMSREIVFNNLDRFNWVQLASGMKHHLHGGEYNVTEEVEKETGLTDVYVKLYPYNGYGDEPKLREILDKEDIDAILHFTDPRYWQWLYNMEDVIHQEYGIPIIYYAIWDNLPYPHWNYPSYASCDMILGISKQSHLIHEMVLKNRNHKTFNLQEEEVEGYKYGDVILDYIPHGIDSTKYYPIKNEDEDYEEFIKFKKNIYEKHKCKFVFFWANRNITRKHPAELIHAFKIFRDLLPKNKQDEVMLLMHTNPQDQNGTDLIAVKEAIAPECNIVFSTGKVNDKQMNFFYNLADATLNIAGNEGFGLSSAESIMAGTMIINTVTGGLQDQMRFTDTKGNWFTPTDAIPSNHKRHYENHGTWAIPVFPTARYINGSVPTPYIFHDVAEAEDIAEAMYRLYKIKKPHRKQRGQEGRNWLMSQEAGMEAKMMGERIGNAIQIMLDNYKKPKNKFTIEKISFEKSNISSGVVYEF